MRITNLMGLTKEMKNRVSTAPKVLHIVNGKKYQLRKSSTNICFVNCMIREFTVLVLSTELVN